MPLFLTLTLIIISAWAFYTVIKIPTKRLFLILKLKSICKRQGLTITVNHVFRSMFKRENEPDIVIKTSEGGYRVFILTTRFHRVRYHFPRIEYFEVMGKGVSIVPGRIIAGRNGASKSSASFNYEFYKTEYENFDLTDNGSGLTTVLLIHPIPLEVSSVKKSETVHLWNGDELYNGVLFYSGGGFKELLKRK